MKFLARISIILIVAAAGSSILPTSKGLLAKNDVHLFGKGEGDDKGLPIKTKAKGAVNESSAYGEEMKSKFKCGETSQTDSSSDKYELCPESCPYFAQNREDTLHCTFLCVAADQCGRWNPNKPIADSLKGTRTCRGPRVNFCTEMNMDGTDSCKVCQSGFEVHADDGGCYFSYWNTLMIVTLIIVALVVVLAVWVIDLCCRENINNDVLAETLEWRSRSKILQPKTETGRRHVYDWQTNLCKVDVAGPGMLLHFRYQVFVIAWALVVAILWTLIACFHNELFILGTRRFGTPRQNCILVAWGYETQQRLMYTKVGFLAIVYLFTFVSTLVFAVYQRRIFMEMDAKDKTYKDFCLELQGLPELPANNPNIENAIRKEVEAQSGKKVVGISVAWNFTAVQDDVMQLVAAKENVATEVADANKGDDFLIISGLDGLRVGEEVVIGSGKEQEAHAIKSISKPGKEDSNRPGVRGSPRPGKIMLAEPLKYQHKKGAPISLKEFIKVSGATGEKAETINGDYEKTGMYNSRSLWQKGQGGDAIVVALFKDNKWHVAAKKGKDVSEDPSGNYLVQSGTPEEGDYSPTLVEEWADMKDMCVEYFKGCYPEDPTNLGGMRTWMYGKEKGLLGPDPIKEVDPMALLDNMKSSSTAYVVFQTEFDKEDVFRRLRGIQFKPADHDIKCDNEDDTNKEYIFKVDRVYCEPAAINWNYFGDDTLGAMVNRFVKQFCTWYLGALSIWFFVFYVPYAISLYNFNYDNGAELPSYYGLIFTMVVVGGNATMYIICDLVAENIQFRYKDTKQVVYVLMYLFACTVNVLLDMVVTYFTARKIMIGLDFRTYDGRLLSDIPSFTEQFETYAMQRSLAENTYAYAFPSTFLIPFLLEPFVTIIVPRWVGMAVVRTHREITGQCAENYLAAFDFDLGRYADILLNIFLGILIFYFPGGYTWSLFYGMFISHIVIYVFDHWRVLNVIPNVKIVSMEVDWWSQLMFIPCCALILSCLVFKANCESYVGYCVQDMELIYSTTLAGIIHCIVHFMLFKYLVPHLAGVVQTQNLEGQFKEVAIKDAHGWFAVNPVHCLRSQYIRKHQPYSRYCSVGKEHFLVRNEDIGCYFQDEAAETEESFAEEVEEEEAIFATKARSAYRRLTGTGSSKKMENPAS